jgi:hypothetical protein
MIRSRALRRNEAAVPMRSEALRGRPAIPVFDSRPASWPEYSRTVLPRRVLMKCLESPARPVNPGRGFSLRRGLPIKM